jgi:hypothetical protein
MDALPRTLTNLCALFGAALCLFGPRASAGEFRRGADEAYSFRSEHYSARVTRGVFQYRSGGSAHPDMTYALHSVRIGDHHFRLGHAPRLAAHANVVCRYYGDGISESYTARPEGVQQCWVIGKRPKAVGDLIIEGRVITPYMPKSTPKGLALVEKDGRAALSYGAVTVVDSAGNTCERMPSIEKDRLRIVVPASYIAQARFPILVDPVVGPEVPICPTFGSADNLQENVDIAAGPNGYFAVWQDSRGSNGTDIFATRISPTGEVMDPMGIPICTASGNQTDPAVAWNGKQYFVVWTDRQTSLPHIYGARVQPNGEVVDKQGMLLSSTSGAQAYPDVASDGSGWQVVWQQQITGSLDVYGVRVSGDGSVSRIYGLATGTGDEDYPSVAWNGSTFLVVWRDNRTQGTTGTDIYGCRVGRNGIGLPGTAIISCDSSGSVGVAGDQLLPQVCSFGSTFMVVWEDRRTGTSKVYASRVDSTPKSIDRNGILVADSTGAQESPSVAYDGTRLLVAWRTSSEMLVRGARISTTGSVLDPNGRSISSGRANSSGVAVCANGAFMVGWSNLTPGNSDVLVTPVSGNGVVSYPAGVVASLGLCDQRDHAVAYNGSEYAVVWAQTTNGGSHIWGARLSRNGTLLTPNPVSITLSVGGTQSQPDIAWNGTNYLLVWTHDSGAESDIKGCRLRSDLSSVEAVPITICSAVEKQARPCVASGGGAFLVAWEDSRNAISPYYYTDIYGALVSSGGSVTPLAAAISLGSANQLKPRAASEGSAYLVVWEDYRDGYSRVYGTKVTSAGAVQHTSGIAFPQTSYIETKPQVCFGGGNYFVVWSDWYSITGCRVSTTGTVIDAAGVSVSGGSVKYCPGVCWDGSAYRVVWEDYRSAFQGNADVYYTTVSQGGIVSSSPDVALVSDMDPQLRPLLVVPGSPGFLLYSRYVSYSNCLCGATLTDQQVQEINTVGEAKRMPPGTLVALRGKVVTGAFPGYFYMQELDRSSGIKVVSTVPVNRGDIVDAVGTISVCDGERQINAGMLGAMGVAGSPPSPLGIRGDALGGGPLNAYTPGITAGIGANNIGLLVRTWGKVTSTGSDYFCIESKPALVVKVKSGSLVKPAVGKWVAVTGICTCDVASGAIGRAILPREQADIKLLN